MNIEIIEAMEIGQRVGDLLTAQLKRKPDSVLGMTTGSSPLKYGIFQEWIDREAVGKLSFAEAVFLNPDELAGIPSEHPESYRSYMERHLFRHLRTVRHESHIPNGAANDLQEECRRFDRVLRELGYADWQLMGLGTNGHIAFIEPADSIPAATYVADLYDMNRPTSSIHFRSQEEAPKQAVTIGLEAVMRARAIVLVAAGEEKTDIVHRAFQGPITTQVPASLLQLHSNVTVILDECSARRFCL